jgi:adenosine deaminase
VGRSALPIVIALFVTISPPFAAQRPAASGEAQTARYLESIRKDPNLLIAFLLEMPKGGDLHVHLSGAIYAETLIQWAIAEHACADPKTFSLTSSLRQSSGKPVCPPPLVSAETALSDPVLYRSMIDAYSMRNWKVSGQSGHDHFFDTFAKFNAATESENTGKMLADTAKRAAAQHEVYQELMFTPTGKPFADMLEAEAVVEAAKAVKLPDDPTPEDFAALQQSLAALQKAMQQNGLSSAIQDAIQQTNEAEKSRDKLLKCGTPAEDLGCKVTQRYLFQVGRGREREIVFAQILMGFEMAKTDPRFLSLNLVMPEDYYIPMHDFPLHMQMLKYLHAQYPGVPLTLHAGELAAGLVPPEGLRFHVRDSVEIAGAERIGHGVDVLNENNPLQLLEEMAQKSVMVEICLSSNATILGISGKDHPLHDYMRAGVPVALATDDEGVARSDMTHEYLRGVEEQNLTYLELKRMARTSLEHSFIHGASLWSDGKTFAPVKDCAATLSSATIPASCQAFLNANEKAKLQLALEQQFRDFESRKWPAITVESSPAAAR